MEIEYICKDCDESWVTSGDRPKCPECRSENYHWAGEE